LRRLSRAFINFHHIIFAPLFLLSIISTHSFVAK
jgi:hypothetical protein